MPVPPTATPVPPTATPTSPAATEVSSTPAAAGKIETVQGNITSKALAGNLLDDPTTRTYSILLPHSYATSDKRYPVVYVLHWYTGNNYAMVGSMLANYMTLLREGKVQEMIFVFPDASNKLGGSSVPEFADHRRLRDLYHSGVGGFRRRHLSHHPGPQQPRYHWLFHGRRWIDRPGAEIPGRIQRRSARIRPHTIVHAILSCGKKRPEASDEDPPEDLTDFWISSNQWQARASPVLGRGCRMPILINRPFYLDMPVALVDGKAQDRAEVFDRMIAADPTHQVDRYLSQPERLRAIRSFTALVTKWYQSSWLAVSTSFSATKGSSMSTSK